MGRNFSATWAPLKGNRAKSGTIKKEEENEKRDGLYERRENQSIYRGRSIPVLCTSLWERKIEKKKESFSFLPAFRRAITRIECKGETKSIDEKLDHGGKRR